MAEGKKNAEVTVVDRGLKVTVELGATLPFGDHGFVKPTIKIDGLNPDSAQLEQDIIDGINTAQHAMVAIDEQLEVTISQLLAPATGQPGARDRLEKLEKSMSTATENIRRIATRLKEVAPAVAPAVKARSKKETQTDGEANADSSTAES